ncbi:MAG TPA: tetratricopeptide repeat protein [Gemmatimonadales bacterium]|nr:tetratricopeptide repeat protein [Gemmatimonadales bacterium]
MATTVQATTTPRVGQPTAPTPWYRDRMRLLIAVVVAVLLVAAGAWFVTESGRRKEAQATTRLSQALAVADRGNLPQAAADLQRLIQTYQGTSAATEAVIALNQVRVASGQTELAANNLRQFVATNPPPRYIVPAYGLLGAALESGKKFAEAAQAFEQAAQHAELGDMKASYLLEAARAYREAGKTQEAVRAYRTVLERYPNSPAVTEAQVRLGELTAGAM